MRPIDADALEALVKGHGCDKCPGGALQCTFCTLNQFIAMIDSAPTIDVQPVRRGEWRVTEAWPHKVYCTNCYVTIGVSTVPGDVEAKCVPRTNFCHECGADMRGERFDGDDT